MRSPGDASQNHVTEWELQLAPTAQHQEKESNGISQAQKTDKIQSIVSIEHVSLSHHHKVEKQ